MEVSCCELTAIKLKVNVKVKFTLEQATKSQRGVDVYISTPFVTPTLDVVGGQRQAQAGLPLGITR